MKNAQPRRKLGVWIPAKNWLKPMTMQERISMLKEFFGDISPHKYK